jgi:hypothetical protein
MLLCGGVSVLGEDLAPLVKEILSPSFLLTHFFSLGGSIFKVFLSIPSAGKIRPDCLTRRCLLLRQFAPTRTATPPCVLCERDVRYMCSPPGVQAHGQKFRAENYNLASILPLFYISRSLSLFLTFFIVYLSIYLLYIICLKKKMRLFVSSLYISTALDLFWPIWHNGKESQWEVLDTWNPAGTVGNTKQMFFLCLSLEDHLP